MFNKLKWYEFCEKQGPNADMCRKGAIKEISILEGKASLNSISESDKRLIEITHNSLKNNGVIVGTGTLLQDLYELISA